MPRALELALVLLTAPLWVALMGLVALALLPGGRPLLFLQRRPGLHGRPFTILKFRTMRPGPGTDAERVTRVGRILRATSLDELPELINVLRGEMALVGPRPLLMEYLAEYTPAERHRHDVRPGITGWAQIHGRNAIDRAEKICYDLEYVARRSTAFDFRILFLTLFHLKGN